MFEEHRVAARYSFVDELWRGRARVVVDPALEAMLLARPAWLTGRGDSPLRDLVDALLPVKPSPEEPVWLVVSSAGVAAQLGRMRPGTIFVPEQGVADVLERAAWDVALMHVGTTREDAAAADGRQRDLERVWLERVAAHPERSAVISANVQSEADPRGWDYGEFEDAVLENRERARLFGLYFPATAAVVDFGDPGGGGDEDDSQDVPLSFDNTLGSQEPELLEWLAICGRDSSFNEGLTLIELSAVEPTQSVRAQQGDALRGGAQRERLVERLEADNAALRQEVEELRATLERAASRERVELEETQRYDAALVREQTLKWQLAQLEREVAVLRGRPVDVLQAEVAQLRARLNAAAEGPTSAKGTAEDANGEEQDEGQVVYRAPFMPLAARLSEASTRARTRLGDPHTQSALSAVEALVRRLERGGIGTLELRQELVALRRRLLTSSLQ